jgi:hypothetical protein
MEERYAEDCLVLEEQTKHLNEVLRLNSLYLKEIDSCKEEMRTIQEEK